MSLESRFQPPAAAVADVVPLPPSRGATVALAIATLVQILWTGHSARAIVMLTSDGNLEPLVLAMMALGLACLYVGVARLAFTGARGGRWLVAAAAGLALTALAWRRLMFADADLRSFLFYGAPTVLGLAIAVAGILVARGRARAAA